MELHQIKYFIEVARERSFTKAAANLYLAQPSLSVQIRKLEDELGTELFERLGRRIEITPAGKLFLEHAKRSVFEIEHGREKVSEIQKEARGRVTFGVLPSFGIHLLPKVLNDYKARYPGVRLKMVELDSSAAAEQMVDDGKLDFGIIRLPHTHAELQSRLLCRDRMVAIVPPEHRLGAAESIDLSQLADEDFIGMHEGHGLRELMDQACARAGFQPNVTVATGQIAIVLGMVDAGVGVSILPSLAAGRDRAKVAVNDPLAYREVGVVFRSGDTLLPSAYRLAAMLAPPMSEPSGHRPAQPSPPQERAPTSEVA